MPVPTYDVPITITLPAGTSFTLTVNPQGDSMDLATIQKKLDAISADAAHETDLTQSIIKTLNGQAAVNAALAAQLKAALAGIPPGTVDPTTAAALQAVADGLDAVHTVMTKDASDIAASIIANTPAANG